MQEWIIKFWENSAGLLRKGPQSLLVRGEPCLSFCSLYSSGFIAMNRERPKNVTVQICCCALQLLWDNPCEISQWQEDIQYCKFQISLTPGMHWECTCHRFMRFTELRVLWFFALNQNIHLVQGSGKRGHVSFTKLLSLHKYCQSELSESSGSTGKILLSYRL